MGVSRVDRRDQFNFTIQSWFDGKPDEIIAGAQSVSVAHAAFDMIVQMDPHREFILCQGGRVFRKHPENLPIR